MTRIKCLVARHGTHVCQADCLHFAFENLRTYRVITPVDGSICSSWHRWRECVDVSQPAVNLAAQVTVTTNTAAE